MTVSNPMEAYGDVYQLLVDAWENAGPIEFWDKPVNPNDPIPPKDGRPWMRIKMKQTGGFQATLANEVGQRRFRKTGFVLIQLFTPLGTSLRDPSNLGILLNNALEGASTPHDVLLRNVRMEPIGSDGHWFQTQIMADFEYDSLR
jgi:hypothetical protein